MSGVTDRIGRARCGGAPAAVETARRGLLVWAEAQGGDAVDRLADGAAATGLGRIVLQGTASPAGLACDAGCAFCCILSGVDGGTISEAEARGLHEALLPFAGQPDGRQWHPEACAALDPETRMCRAYDARPMICRTYVSTDVDACRSLAEEKIAKPGPGTLGAYHTYLAALGLSRVALKGARRVSTYAMARVAAAAVEGQDVDAALRSARHASKELDEELRRSKRDSGLALSSRS